MKPRKHLLWWGPCKYSPPALAYSPNLFISTKKKIQPRKTAKIGRPGYRVTKQREPTTGQLSLLFQIDYPEIEEGLQPRHRFMSAYEQKVETPDKNYQYILFAAEPYGKSPPLLTFPLFVV